MSGKVTITTHPEAFDIDFGIEEFPHKNDNHVTVTDLASTLGKSRSNFLIKIKGLWEVLERPTPVPNNAYKTEAVVTQETAKKIEAWYSIEAKLKEAKSSYRLAVIQLQTDQNQTVAALLSDQAALENK